MFKRRALALLAALLLPAAVAALQGPAFAQGDRCRVATADGGAEICACERSAGWRIVPMDVCVGSMAPAAAPSGRFTAPAGRAWVCYLEYADRGRAIGRGQGISSGRGERYRVAEIRVFQRQSGRYVVCAGDESIRKMEQKRSTRLRDGIFASIRLLPGDDFTALVWSSPQAQNVDSGRQQAEINRQLGAVVQGFEGAQAYCAENPEACASDPGEGRDPSVDIMDDVICRDRGVC